MVSEVRVPLKDIYVGRTFDISISRKAICDACDGSGARDPSDVVHCQTCNGQGVRLVRHQIAPGFFTQAQATCVRASFRDLSIAPVENLDRRSVLVFRPN